MITPDRPPDHVVLIIAASTIFAVIVSVISLMTGLFIIFQNLFYVPIIIASLYYAKKGFVFSFLLAFLYLTLFLAFSHESGDVTGALIRFVIFVFVAGLTAYLSIKWLSVRKLTESEARYRELFNNMSSGVAVYQVAEGGEDFIFKDFNRAAESIEGLSRDEVIGRSVLEIFPEIKNYSLFNTFRRVWKTGVPEDHPLSFYKDNRITGWRDNYVYKLPSGEIVAIYDDITEKKQFEEALRESETNYQNILQNMQDAYFRAAPDGQIIMANPSAASLFGYDSVEDIIGIPALSLYSCPEDRQNIVDALETDGHLEDFISQGVKNDGKTFWVSMNVQQVRDDQGNITAVEGFVRDITDRKRSEEALQESEKKYRDLVENISDVILKLNTEGKITYVSPVVERTYGYNPEEITGESFTKFVHSEDLPEITSEFSRLLNGEFVDSVFRIIARDGRICYIRTTMTPIIIGNSITGFNFVLTDFSERRKAEDSLHKANKKLKMLSQITRHDILNLIMAIRGYLELSEGLTDNEELRKYIKIEREAVDAIQKQIEFTRSYESIGVNEPGWQNLEEIIGKVLEQLPVEDITIEGTLKGIEIFADPLTGKVFYNLVENSLRHGGGVTLISFSSYEADGRLVVSYRDNGAGIPDEDKENVFTKGFGKNNGLGLFLSREILSITGITIHENGKAGKGVNFEIIFPEGNYRYNTDDLI